MSERSLRPEDADMIAAAVAFIEARMFTAELYDVPRPPGTAQDPGAIGFFRAAEGAERTAWARLVRAEAARRAARAEGGNP